jgi:AraC family transcriptional regulator
MDERIDHVIAVMRTSLGERLTLDDLAREARFSKFHFTRLFTRATGLSPLRFLSALRLEEAKRLLLTTRLTVTEISHRVGYDSVGTFTSRFGSSVGVPPKTFRRLDGVLEVTDLPAGAAGGGGTVTATVRPPSGVVVGAVHVGLFPTPVPERSPVRCAVLDGPGTCRLEDVPPGRWFVAAMTRPADWDGNPADGEWFVGGFGPFWIEAASQVHGTVQLTQRLPNHPPVLLAMRYTRYS